MGIVGAIVIARWAWTLMGTTAAVLLDRIEPHVAEEIRTRVEAPGDVQVTDLHMWKVGPQAHAAIASAVGSASMEVIRARGTPVHKVRHLTVEVRAG